MKNIIQFIFVFVFCNTQYNLNAQSTPLDPCNNSSINDTIDAYYDEIDARLATANLRMTDMCNGIRLTLDNDIEETVKNFEVLNDRGSYTQNSGTHGKECKWPMIVEANSSYNSNIEYIILTPGDYRDYLTFYPWVNNHSTATKYLLYYPGSSTDSDETILSYFNYDTQSGTTYCDRLEPAITQAEEKRAFVENFNLNYDANSSGNKAWTWVIMGITFSGNRANYYSSDYSHPTVFNCPADTYTGGTDNSITSSGNIISHCLLENTIKPHFMRIRGSASHNIIINNTIRNRHDMSHRDVMGITLSASYGEVAENNVIMNNDIYNIGDAIQMIYDPACRDTTNNGIPCISGCIDNNYGDGNGFPNDCFCDPTDLGQKGTVPGTFIHNNRMFNQKIYTELDRQPRQNLDTISGYNTPGEYFEKNVEKMHGEGAIDIKVGGLPDNKAIISGNHIYGWRHGRADNNEREGGNGHAVITHVKAQDVVIINNKISDCANGIHINARGSSPVHDLIAGYDCDTIQVKHIEVYDNQICDLYNPFDNEIHSLNAGIPLEYGVAIRVAIPTAIVVGNNIRNAARGIQLLSSENDPEGYFATIFDNYFENITNQALIDPAKPLAYTNFNCNVFLDADYSCNSLSMSNDLESTLEDQNNCFLREKARITLGTLSNLNQYEEDDVCQ